MIDDPLGPLKAEMHAQAADIRRKSQIRLGRVTQVSPLLVALDGDIDVDETSPTFGQPVSAPAVSIVTHTVGQRVICAEQHNQLLVIQSGA